MRMVRITTKQKPVLKYLEEVWEAPDDQDIPTADIIKWLRQNLHRSDIGLWVALDKGDIVGAILAFGPDLLQPQVHIYTAWLKKGCKINSREFFEGEFEKWVRQQGAQDITICSASHSGRAWERRFGFKGYSRMYIRRLEPITPPVKQNVAVSHPHCNLSKGAA